MLDRFYGDLAASSGSPPDYVRLFSLFIVAYPLALPLAALSPTAKHAVNIAVTTLFIYGVLGLNLGYLQLLGNTLVTYFLTKNNIGGKQWMPWLVFGFEMGHLTINHCVRAFGNIPLTTIEITAMQMVLTMNLTSFAWSAHDGVNRKETDCDDQQRSMRITTEAFPSLLEFLGYAFYFPGVLIGPSTRFVDYRAWSTGEIYKTNDKSPPAGRYAAAAIEALMGCFYMGVWMLLSGRYSYEALVAPQTDPMSAKHLGFLGRVLFLQLAGLAARAKYYGIWTLTNGACILSGLSFNGSAPDGKARWDRCKNINVLGVELANNWKELLDNWNMNTNVWLRNNVYKRVAKRGKKPGFKSTMMTFLTSAFWHGVAPGYYLTFFLGGLFQSVGRSMRAHFRPFAFQNTRAPNPTVSTLRTFTPFQLLYSLASIALVHITINFSVVPFMLLEVGKSIEGWRTLHFYGIWMALGAMIAFQAGLGRILDNFSGAAQTKRKERDAREQAARDSQRSAGAGPGNGNPQIPDIDVVGREAIESVEGKKQ